MHFRESGSCTSGTRMLTVAIALQLASSKSTWSRAKSVLLGRCAGTNIPHVPYNGDINP